jgi:hypothetical protein
MQRRAAAISAVVFILLAAGSYSLIATAETPTLEFEEPTFEGSAGDEVTVDGRTYTVQGIDAQVTGGGHGSAGTLSRSGTLAWTNESGRYTVTWENGSTVELDNESLTVAVENASEPTEFALVEQINRTAILADDPNADAETVTQDGVEYVVVTEGDRRTLVPAAEYFPDPDRTTYAEGDTVQFQGNRTTVSSVTAEGATLAWTGPKTTTLSLSDEGNVTLGPNDRQFLAHFPDNETLVLTDDYESYRAQQDQMADFTRFKNGFWGVSIVSGVSAVLLIGLAYMPSRY